MPCRLSHTVPLSLVSSLAKERSLVAWVAATSHLSAWRRLLLENSAGRAELDRLTLGLLEPIYQELGWAATGSHVTK